MDIGAVDDETCIGVSHGACAQLVRELPPSRVRCAQPSSSTAGIPTGPPTRAVARADHCDHIHWEVDA
jgi:hypothetical protein